MSIVRNSSIVFIGSLAANFLAYVYHFIAGRVLGPEEYGTLGALLAFFALITVPLGAINSALTKFAGRYHSMGSFGALRALRDKVQVHVFAIGVVVMLLLLLLLGPLVAYLKVNSAWSIVWLGVAFVFHNLYYANLGLLSGLRRFYLVSWIGVAEAVVRLVLLYILCTLSPKHIGGVISFALAYITSFFIAHRYASLPSSGDTLRGEFSTHEFYRFALTFLAFTMLLQIVLNVPLVLVNHYYSKTVTGYWTAAVSISKISLVSSTAITQVMFAEMASSVGGLKEKGIIRAATILVLLSTALFAAIFCIFPEAILHVAYGEQFVGAARPLQFMGLFMVAFSLAQLYVTYILAKRG